MQSIQIHDRDFELFLPAQKIERRVVEIASQINALQCENAVIISVLSGAFMFTSDVCKRLNNVPDIQFVKISSYTGMRSNGAPTLDLALKTDIAGKDVFIFEDIVDTGETIHRIHDYCTQRGAGSIRIASLLLKPDAYTFHLPIDYVGFEIPDNFVVGYGLDYDGLGRNLPDIYKVVGQSAQLPDPSANPVAEALEAQFRQAQCLAF
jgi:hypoxanthine phosphoribosyltransferase